MNPAVTFLLAYLVFCGMVAGLIAAIWNCDRITVMVFRLLNAPVYPEARMISGLIYQHPEQWKNDSYGMEHPKVGRVRIAYTPHSIEVESAFGRWEPNKIERRIIYDAIIWYRTAYIKRLLGKALDA